MFRAANFPPQRARPDDEADSDSDSDSQSGGTPVLDPVQQAVDVAMRQMKIKSYVDGMLTLRQLRKLWDGIVDASNCEMARRAGDVY